MFFNFVILALCACVTVAAVRLLVIHGIEIICQTLRFSSKTKGQIIGYATSLPEFVIIVASAFAGVFDAGFWNIASSNIINALLFFSAVIFYKQQSDLFNAVFIDEVIFALVSIAVPLLMLKMDVGMTSGTAVFLILLFVSYRVIDHFVNLEKMEESDSSVVGPGILKGVCALIAGVLIIVVSGWFLGESAKSLILETGTSAWLVGWILGFITSIPELTSFFEIYRLEKKKKRLHLISDTQQALDALVASNTSNLGIILPVGMIIYCFKG